MLAEAVAPVHSPPSASQRVYYGWVMVVLAAVAMTATLPGRTHGLGLIAEPLINDPALGISRTDVARLNFYAILIGSICCLPIGRWIDRRGVRLVLAFVAGSLGLSVLLMSRANGIAMLFVTLTLIRGLGQGALSLVSIAMISKWFVRRLPTAMALFTVLLSFGFIASILIFGTMVKSLGWRDAWAGLGLLLFAGMMPLGLLLARNTPESIGVAPDRGERVHERSAAPALSLLQALRSPSFWAFSFAGCFFNLVWSAITLFNESLLESRGLGHDVYLEVMAMMVFTGLPANFLCGWLSRRWGMRPLLAFGMLALAISLAWFPMLQGRTNALLYGGLLGVAGGIVTVIFFSFYGDTFGRAHVGAIQAAAQTLTVLASAVGPLLLTHAFDWYGDNGPFFRIAALSALLLGLAVAIVPLPKQPELVDGRLT